MIYSDGVPMDDNGRVRYCPRCQNQELDPDSEFCQICGLTLYNTCAGDWQDNIPEHRNKSNARFCKYCGLPTTYYQQNILQPYSEILKNGITPAPPLLDPDDIYDRYVEMSIVTGGSLMTAEDMQEFSEIIGEDGNEEVVAGSDIPF